MRIAGDGEIIIVGWTAALALALEVVLEGDGGPASGCESGATECTGQDGDAWACECECECTRFVLVSGELELELEGSGSTVKV